MGFLRCPRRILRVVRHPRAGGHFVKNEISGMHDLGVKNRLIDAVDERPAGRTRQWMPLGDLSLVIKKNHGGPTLEQMERLRLVKVPVRADANPAGQHDQHLVNRFIRSLMQADPGTFQGAGISHSFQAANDRRVYKSGVSIQNKNVFRLLPESHADTGVFVWKGSQARELRG